MPDLRESYNYKDPRPFGASVAYSIVKNVFNKKQLAINKQPFADNYGWDYDTASLYINISRNYYSTERDANALLEFIYKGNVAFISAANYDTLLLNKLFCKQYEANKYNRNSFATMQNTSTRFTGGLTLYKDTFKYFYFPFVNSFTEINGSYGRIVGYNEEGKANFFVFLWGSGRIYFHNEPRTLSNYFLLTKNNYLYLQQIMQMMPQKPENIYWDNYYSNKNYSPNAGAGKSTLDTIFKFPPLAKAFFIALGMLLLYVFFNSKRRQRIVPIIKSNNNSSIAFAEAIAGLYLNNKDNKVIADKIITYFNEYVRSKYFITVNVQDASYEATLYRKSGVDIEIVKELTATIKKINSSIIVSDEALLNLNGLIEKFFKK